MPRYFFEMIDGPQHVPDGEGTELPTPAEAREEALRALGERVRYELPDGDRREFGVTVSDERGRKMLRANLSLSVEYEDAFREIAPSSPRKAH